LSSQQ
jgi:hypothetical protein